MSRLALAGLAAAGLLALTGCGERSEPTAAHVSPYPVSVRGTGEASTVLTKRPTRIVPLAAGVAELLTDLGARGQLVAGRSGSTEIWKLSGAALARAVVALRPDLVVASSQSDPADVARAGRASGAPVYLVPDSSLAELGRGLTHLGLLTDHAVAARGLVRANERARAATERRVRGEPVLRVFLDTGFFTTVSSRTLFSDLLRLAGGRNVAGPRPEPGPFSLQQLGKLDPQVYLATADSETTLRYLRRNPRTKRLTAVRTGRFRLIDPSLLELDGRLGPRLELLARLLHPRARG